MTKQTGGGKPSPSLKRFIFGNKDVSEYAGYTRSLEDIFDLYPMNGSFSNDLLESAEPTVFVLPKRDTRKRLRKDNRWRNRQYTSKIHEKNLFLEIQRELETINVAELLSAIEAARPKKNSDIVDLIYSLDKQILDFRPELYAKVRKLTNEKYRSSLSNKINAIWRKR